MCVHQAYKAIPKLNALMQGVGKIRNAHQMKNVVLFPTLGLPEKNVNLSVTLATAPLEQIVLLKITEKHVDADLLSLEMVMQPVLNVSVENFSMLSEYDSMHVLFLCFQLLYLRNQNAE